MYKNILVAVALDHSPDGGKAFAIAQALADAGARITALNILEEIPVYAAHYIPDELLTNRRSEAEAELKAEIGGIANVQTAVITGHAGQGIVTFAKENDIDCIIINSHRPGLQDFFLGSTANRVVRHAECAVHVLR